MDDARENAPSGEITVLLHRWKRGDQEALERLMSLVYVQLRQQAASYLSRERPEHTLQPTAVVNEAYMRLAAGTTPSWNDRVDFLSTAATVMRHVLIDHARKHRRQKRGGEAVKVQLEEAEEPARENREVDLLALEESLSKLESLDPRRSKLVELRFFGGLSLKEIGDVMQLSVPTVGRELRLAKAWLYHQLSSAGAAGESATSSEEAG